MTLVLDDAAVRQAFDWGEAVAALRSAYSSSPDETRFPPRRMARGDHGWLRTLTGVPAGSDLMGLKVIAASPVNGRASYLVPLFDQRTAELVAILDGHSITGFRTAATSALAADVLAPAGVVDVAVIGSGFEARHHLRALAAVRDVKRARVFSPSPDSRAAFAADLSDVADVEAVDSVGLAVEAATVVMCAARSRDESPTLPAGRVQSGATVLSIGSTLPEQREVDVEVVARADLLVADMVEEVLGETGDLLAAEAAGFDARAKTVALADVVSGRHPGRRTADQVVLYKSVGSAVQDLAVAEMCVRAARNEGLGAELAVGVRPVQK